MYRQGQFLSSSNNGQENMQEDGWGSSNHHQYSSQQQQLLQQLYNNSAQHQQMGSRTRLMGDRQPSHGSLSSNVSGYPGVTEELYQPSENNRDYRTMSSNTSQISGFTPIGFCEEHGDPITNYCACLDCLRGLCPDCIDAHYKQHMQAQTSPQIESIKHMKLNCSKKVVTAISQLSKEIQDCQEAYLRNPETHLQVGLATIQQTKEKVLVMVRRFFENQEDIFIKRSRESVFTESDFEQIFEKVYVLSDELEQLRAALITGDQTTQLASITRICRLDFISLRDRFKADIAKVAASRDTEPLQVCVDEQRIMQLKADLEAVVKINKQNEMLVKYKQQQLQSTPPRHSSNEPTNTGSRQSQQNSHRKAPSVSIERPRSGISLSSPGRGLESHRKTVSVSVERQRQSAQKPLLASSPRKGFQSVATASGQASNVVIEVSQSNYFEESKSTIKSLNFFLNDETASGQGKMISVELPSLRVTDTPVGISIPSFHKTVTLSNGDVYLIGGTNADGSKSGAIYKHQSQLATGGRVLVKESDEMSVSRSSFGVCFLRNCIYVVSGITSQNMYVASCERFNLKTRKWEAVASVNQPSSSLCCVAFNGRFIFKIGGGNQDEKFASKYIEKYDLMNNKWHLVTPQVRIAPLIGPALQFLANSSAAQLNPNEIFVFGGYDVNGICSSQSFVLHVEEQCDVTETPEIITPPPGKEENFMYSIVKVNAIQLPIAEGFLNPQTVVIDQIMYALQDAPEEGEDDTLLLPEKKTILSFNGHKWKVLGEV